MNGIVLDLQREALTQSGDVLSLLRKAYLIARKLHLKDFGEWLNKELNGYGTKDKVPNYRILRGEVKAWNPMRGWIPVLFDREYGFNIHQSRDSIANLINIYSTSKGQPAIVNFPAEINSFLGKNAPIQTKYALHISTNQIYTIVESVRTAVLEWSIVLEENGIIGEEMQFSKEEQEIAVNTPTINNYTTNFFADVSNSQVQQGTDNSTQAQ